MDKVIEAMAKYLTSQFICDPSIVPADECITEAKELLNLCYDCGECDGEGRTSKHDSRGLKHPCSDCLGTGKLLDKKGNPVKMLAVLSENQELPKYSRSLYMMGAQDVAWVQKQMIESGWRKVQEDNDATG